MSIPRAHRDRPDAFLPDLAASLNNQSLRLAGLGRREEALAAIEEAVTIRRDLARARRRPNAPLRPSPPAAAQRTGTVRHAGADQRSSTDPLDANSWRRP
jgi:hypothetical protein